MYGCGAREASGCPPAMSYGAQGEFERAGPAALKRG